MKAPTNSQLRLIWSLSVAVIAVMWLLPFTSSQIVRYNSFIDRGWLHFLVFAILATISMLAWRQPTSILTAVGLFGLSVCLQFAHSARAEINFDRFALITNLLGILAGVLLGINIATLKSRLKRPSQLESYQSE